MITVKTKFAKPMSYQSFTDHWTVAILLTIDDSSFCFICQGKDYNFTRHVYNTKMVISRSQI